MGRGLDGMGGMGVYGRVWEFSEGWEDEQGGSREGEEETLVGFPVKRRKGGRWKLVLLLV